MGDAKQIADQLEKNLYLPASLMRASRASLHFLPAGVADVILRKQRISGIAI